MDELGLVSPPPVARQQPGDALLPPGRPALKDVRSCKPACAWQHVTKGLKINGYPKVCNKDNAALRDGQNATSACAEGGGAGYLCSSYVPVPVEENQSYGFAILTRNDACCKCYELRWTSGAARGKSMVVQAINVAPTGGDVKADDVIVLTPGGGVGTSGGGCKAQYGRTWCVPSFFLLPVRFRSDLAVRGGWAAGTLRADTAG